MPGGFSWRGFWRLLTRFEAEKVAPWMALRNAIGIALPLAVGALTGEMRAAVIVASGALNVAFSDGHDGYAARARRMLLACALVGVAVWLGGVSGQRHGGAVALSACWGFVAGLMVAVSPAASDLGTISLVTLLVFSFEPMNARTAALAGAGAVAGGLLQTLLALSLWPVRRYQPERRALAGLFAELARTAAEPPDALTSPPAAIQSIQARQALDGLRGDHSFEAARYLTLLSQAERIRLSLLALGRLRVRLAREGAPEASTLDEVLRCTANLTGQLGETLSGVSAFVNPESLAGFHRASGALAGAGLHDARHQVDALAGQLRSAMRAALETTPRGADAAARRFSREPWRLRFGSVLATLRANLTPASAAFRHAARVGACVALGDAAGRWLGLERSYWLPMTVAIVLKPDFSATFSRGVLRLAGTFVGLAAATALFRLATPAPLLEVAILAALAFAMRCWGPANYGILVTAVTALVVVLIALAGMRPEDVIAARAWNTLAGGAIALAAYAAWPTWERAQAPETIARLLDAYRDYFRAIRDSYLDPERSYARRLDRTRQAARLARSNFEASVDRVLAEPGTPPATAETLPVVLATFYRLAHALMSLEAGLARSQPVPARPEFRTFADHLELTLYYVASALRGWKLDPEALPDLRADHSALAASGDALTERYALVNTETDRITNSVNTLRERLLGWKNG